MKTLNLILMLLLTSLVIPKIYANDVSENEKRGLQLMREEEKLAHDVYQFLSQKWQIPIFKNIANSEMRHFEAVGYLLNTFDVKDPAIFEKGMFANLEIEHLYDSLTLAGSISLQAALEVGAFIEEFDIADLQKLLTVNTDSIIGVVYQNLLRGSNNHLRAFTGQLESRGEIYIPVILEEAVFQEIVQGSHQMGSGNGCVLQPNNCSNQQNVMPARNRNRGKGRMRGQGRWN